MGGGEGWLKISDCPRSIIIFQLIKSFSIDIFVAKSLRHLLLLSYFAIRYRIGSYIEFSSSLIWC